jgi:general stress protein YciG
MFRPQNTSPDPSRRSSPPSRRTLEILTTVGRETFGKVAIVKEQSRVMDMSKEEATRRPSRRGFAAMDPERRREIARRGGASVPSEKRSFAQDRDLAANAGRKGGAASRGGGRRPSRNPTA